MSLVLLTKSKYLIGLKCPKLLWIAVNAKERLPEPDEAAQYRFDQGHLIGQMAKRWFPDGVDIPEDDFKANIEETGKLLGSGRPLFEAGIMVDDLYSRADILNPVGDGYDIIEVKSSSKVKDVYIEDVAFQRFVYLKAGLKIRRCFVMNINKEYVRSGEIDPKQLLKLEDVTDLVEAVEGIGERVQDMFRVIASPECPDVDIGPHCRDPYACDLIPDCWKHVPENSVFDLHGCRKVWDFFQRGIVSMADVPDDELNAKQLIQKQCVMSGRPHVDREALASFLDALEFPVHYLDFESHNNAVPLYDGIRPYQQVPFQFSLHVQQEDGSLEHHEFLHDSAKDPRPAFLESLRSVIRDSGTILSFYQSFEIGRLRDCAAEFPEYQRWFDDLLPRFADLIVLFRNFHYHSPEQSGSNSIKDVLPALTGQSYEDLDIADGGSAGRAYLSLMLDEDLGDEDKAKIRRDLLKYCERDTEAMVWVVEELRKIVS